jgi:coproporphyrinogen III oxidase
LVSILLTFIIDNVNRKKDLDYNEDDLRALSQKRSRYVEFNLLYDRGTLFGLKTGGNIDAYTYVNASRGKVELVQCMKL